MKGGEKEREKASDERREGEEIRKIESGLS